MKTIFGLRRGLAAGIAFCLLSWAAHSQGFGDYKPQPTYSERVSQSLYVTLRDGVKIAVRIDRPAQNGVAVSQPLPVIWHGTLSIDSSAAPSNHGLSDIPMLTRFGYVVAQVARRGNGQSFGLRRGYNDRNETDDAYELTEWFAAQPWSNRTVGIYGCSNTGDAAMHAMESRPPHLKAVFAGCFSWSKYDAWRRGGIFAQWGTGPQRTVEQDMAIQPVQGDENKLLLRQAADEHQQSTVLYDMWRGLPYRDSTSSVVQSRFWSEGSVASFAPQLRQSGVPLYILGGWHDELRDQGIITLLNVPNSRILIGPWKHCMNDGFALAEEIHRFFDTYLKGLPTNLADEPRVHYFLMHGASGAGHWLSSATWPLAATQNVPLYLHEHALSAKPAARASQTRFSVSDKVSCPGSDLGPFMQPCHVEGEGASFQGESLKQALVVTGNPTARLEVSVDRSDADVFGYLEDVAPDGGVYVVTEGRLKASLRATATPPFKVPGTPWHRAYREDVSPLNIGERVELNFDLMPTSYVFERGHHVQLTVTGIDFRQRDRDPALSGEHVVVYSDSVLNLPVQPSSSAQGG
jgi:predicted acyl esterase